MKKKILEPFLWMEFLQNNDRDSKHGHTHSPLLGLSGTSSTRLQDVEYLSVDTISCRFAESTNVESDRNPLKI